MTDEPALTEEKPPRPANACGNCFLWSPNRGAEILVSEDKKCLHPIQTLPWTDDDMPCNINRFMAPNSREANVPNFVSEGSMTDPNPNKLDGPTEILITTYATPTVRPGGATVSDFDWLVLALKCLNRNFTGQQGITIAHPRHESQKFRTLLDQFKVRLYPYDEVAGKGHIQHMAIMASADTFLPHGTKYVLTTDADGMMKMPSTPEHYAWNDKPYWITRTWESIDPRMPGGDNRQWQPVTDEQLGFASELFTMCMNIQLIPLDLLPHYRAHLEKVHHMAFLDYMLAGRNEFPPTRVDFNALGAFFHKFHRDRFHWFDAGTPPYPVDRKQSYWSHGGITPEIQAEIDGFYQTRFVPTAEELERMAQ